jgi:hypothetical protein
MTFQTRVCPEPDPADLTLVRLQALVNGGLVCCQNTFLTEKLLAGVALKVTLMGDCLKRKFNLLVFGSEPKQTKPKLTCLSMT